MSAVDGLSSEHMLLQELIPRLYRRYNPMSHEEAKTTEREPARRLRDRGHAVWQK